MFQTNTTGTFIYRFSLSNWKNFHRFVLFYWYSLIHSHFQAQFNLCYIICTNAKTKKDTQGTMYQYSILRTWFLDCFISMGMLGVTDGVLGVKVRTELKTPLSGKWPFLTLNILADVSLTGTFKTTNKTPIHKNPPFWSAIYVFNAC